MYNLKLLEIYIFKNDTVSIGKKLFKYLKVSICNYI